MAARLRTLPLSVSGIIVGASLGFKELNTIREVDGGLFQSPVFWFAILTTLGLQILSNFANDYGDGVKGTDNESRIGPTRALQSGMLSKKELLNGIILTAIISFLLATYLIYLSFGSKHLIFSVFYLILGVFCIAAAMKYTMGSSAYGYKGLGDVFVFIFFGLVSVVGCYFLYTKSLSLHIFLPAISIGALSTAVLNLNNLRDHDGDKTAGKNTLVVKMGFSKGKKYHYGLLILATGTLLLFLGLTYERWIHALFLIAFIPLGIHFNTVRNTSIPQQLDPELKKVALSTFLLAILISLGYAI